MNWRHRELTLGFSRYFTVEQARLLDKMPSCLEPLVLSQIACEEIEHCRQPTDVLPPRSPNVPKAVVAV